jgi:hypothetical protein
VNWTALLVVLVLAVGAAVVWIALAAKLVADEEKVKERAEAEARRLAQLREVAERERLRAASLAQELSSLSRESKEEGDEAQDRGGPEK